MNKTVKIILIVVLIIIVIVVIYFLIKNSKPTVVTTTESGSPQSSNSLIGNIANILGGIAGSGWLSNLFGGNKCDPAHPGYTKNGNRDPKCDADTYEPYVSTCNPNLCDTANRGYDQCGNFKFGC